MDYIAGLDTLVAIAETRPRRNLWRVEKTLRARQEGHPPLVTGSLLESAGFKSGNARGNPIIIWRFRVVSADGLPEGLKILMTSRAVRRHLTPIEVEE